MIRFCSRFCGTKPQLAAARRAEATGRWGHGGSAAVTSLWAPPPQLGLTFPLKTLRNRLRSGCWGRAAPRAAAARDAPCRRGAGRGERCKAPVASPKKRPLMHPPRPHEEFRSGCGGAQGRTSPLEPPFPGGCPRSCPPGRGWGQGRVRGGPGTAPPVGFASSPAFLAGPASGQGALVAATLRGTGGRGGWRCRCPRCPLSPAAGPFAVPSLWSLRCPLPSPRRGTRRSSRRFLSAPKRTEWKFNRPLVCVVEISGSCFGIFYDTFVYVGES